MPSVKKGNKNEPRVFRSGFNMIISKHEFDPMFEGMTSAERREAIGDVWLNQLTDKDRDFYNRHAKLDPDSIPASKTPWPKKYKPTKSTTRLSDGSIKRSRKSTSRRLSGKEFSERPLNGYQLFVKKHMNLDENRHLDRHGKFQKIADEWNDMSEKEHNKWSKLARTMQPEDVHLSDIEDISSKHPSELYWTTKMDKKSSSKKKQISDESGDEDEAYAKLVLMENKSLDKKRQIAANKFGSASKSKSKSSASKSKAKINSKSKTSSTKGKSVSKTKSSSSKSVSKSKSKKK